MTQINQLIILMIGVIIVIRILVMLRKERPRSGYDWAWLGFWLTLLSLYLGVK